MKFNKRRINIALLDIMIYNRKASFGGASFIVFNDSLLTRYDNSLKDHIRKKEENNTTITLIVLINIYIF